MRTTRSFALLVACMLVAPAAYAQVGRQLDNFGPPVETQFVESQGAEFGVAPIFGIFWDERCANVEYTFNGNLGANPGTDSEIAPQRLADEVQNGLDRWNAIPTSYIEMNVTDVRDLGARPRVAGDFVNEITFITPADFTALASSPSTTLLADSTFVAGDDLDGDGDSDVFDPDAAGFNTCRDVDGDGDIEFPAGDYLAGTILDNDVQFSSTVFWELDATDTGGADVDGVSVHEFGHSHGHNHSLINQISEDDGSGSTMFPFIDIDDGDAEVGQRTLSQDDIALSSFIYPEGSSATGIAALQSGDIAFEDAFDIVRGTVTRDGGPILGAHVFAIDRDTGDIVTGTYSGRSAVFIDLATGAASAFPESALSGEYELPVPRQEVYRAAVESLDGDPAATNNVSTNAIVGGILGQNDLPEEFFNNANEEAVEFFPGQSVPFFSGSSRAQAVDFVANTETALSNTVDVDFIGTGDLAGATSSFVYAQVFDRAQLDAIIANGDVPVSANIRTGTLDASRVPRYSSVSLALGTVNEDGTATLVRTIREEQEFVGQDGDSTPFLFRNNRGLRFEIRREFNRDPDLQLFVVVEASGDELTPGPSGFPPAFVAIDADTQGQSYQAIDGGPLTLREDNWVIELRFINDGSPVNAFLTRF
ncbi:MAG: matrixin family metalloprotease [Myxococcota bacterium]